MTFQVDNLATKTLYVTAVYAANTAEERNDLWIDLLNIQSSLCLTDHPWLVGGDFNEITHPAEHSDPSVSTITPPMSVFNSCLSQLEIRDLRYHGARFSWSNKCPEDPIAKKLDRALINEAWLDSFPRSLARFLPPDISDHTPCCITLDFPLPLAGTKPFKFFNYLTSHPDFLALVAEAWICTENEIHSLHLLSVLALQQPTSTNFAAERELLAKLNLLKRVEEEYFKQLSRINCLISSRHRKPSSCSLPQHPWASNPKTTLSMIAQVANMIRSDRFSCSPAQATLLSKIPTPDDITKVMFRLNQNKSPGPDGFTSGFYKATWNILGSEVINAITLFFQTSTLPKATNSTILTLIPKFPGATIIKDYRPISCCNTLYKVISKLLVARLKPLLPAIILPNQTAFIKGRLLAENCLLAAEIVSGYHNHRGQKKLTLKIDIAKAFDSVRWDYLLACLKALNLPSDYIQWLSTCYSSPTFSVGINGRLHGFFNGTRGLRQGDPLSPYLFGIVINTLSQKLNEAAQSGLIGYHPNCKDSNLTHLCFADDLLIFTDGSITSVQGVLQVLSDFEALSGLSISIAKSSIFTSGLTEAETESIIAVSGISEGSLPVRYLGLPLNSRKLSMTQCEPMMQQIRSKISAWTSKYLSFAGRQVLISTVIAGITNFWCGAFVLPKECIHAIDKMCNAFLWKGTLEGRYVARVAWDTVTLPKKQGGLGLRNLEQWNRTCTIKLLWLLLFRTESIWAAWIHDNVIKDESFWHMKPRQNHTWLFKQILQERQTALQWFQFEPGDGTDIKFWKDPWTKFGKLINFIGTTGPRLTGIHLDASVADVWRDGCWQIQSAKFSNLDYGWKNPKTLLKFLCVSLPAAANSRRALVPTHLEQERYPKTSNSCLVDVTEPEPN
ncbi:uncharacterized protein LOC125608411 [Brassica napus]|uniref:uncharacterized protein LOC125608411 n=1 Tax=Brassica napus TaxID=3708 RepID=UPI002078D1F5|nr:uncharacterized protein LOC125608411 [Brassica napus]